MFGGHDKRGVAKTCGFSILELLVVVGILAILLGLALPSLRGARQRALAVTCLANLRSLASASTAYSAEDPAGVLIPVHPLADVNYYHIDGIFDYGGADGAPDVWQGRLAPGGEWAADTRPLNAFLRMSGGSGRQFDVYRCPADQPFDPPIAYDTWKIWDDAFRTRGAFPVVGTSYFGNAVRSDRLPNGQPGPITWSFGVFLRRMTRVPAPGDTVLYMEMPGLFNMVRVAVSPQGVKFRSLGLDGWHGSAPRFNFAFCDGHADSVSVPAGSWLPEPEVSPDTLLRRGTLRFDCYPDPPIVDLPKGEEKTVRRDATGNVQ